MKALVLVTGANGFVGQNLCEDLVNAGYRVRGLVMNNQHLNKLENWGVEVVTGDISSQSTIALFFSGVDFVVNVAGKASDWGHYSSFEPANVCGVENVMKESHSSGVKKVIHVSSVAIHGFGSHLETKEEGPFFKTKNPYCLSKLRGEKKAIELAKKLNIALTVIRPANVYGEYDTTTFVHLAPALKKRMIFPIEQGRYLTCPLYVKNLTSAMIRCLEDDKAAGEIFNLSDDGEWTWRQWIELLCLKMDYKFPFNISLPKWLVLSVGYFFEFSFKLIRSKSPPMVTIYRATQATTNYRFSNKKMKNLLNWKPPYNTHEGVARMAIWYRNEVAR